MSVSRTLTILGETLFALVLSAVVATGRTAEPPDETVGDAARPMIAQHLTERSPAPEVLRGPHYSVQVNVDVDGLNIVGDAANEPSIATDPLDPRRIVIGWRQFDTIQSSFRQAGWAYSHDAGRSWTFPGVIEPGVFRSDPVLGADADGNIYYNSLSTDSGYICHVFKSADGGVSWGPGAFAYGGDKQWMTIDRTGGGGHGNIYSFSRDGVGTNIVMTRSTDGGHSFEPNVAVPLNPGRGTIAVGALGEVYAVGRSFDDGQFVLARATNAWNPVVTPVFEYSTHLDLGGSFAAYGGPNPGGLLGQCWVACDTVGGPYHGNVYVLSSVDPPGSDPLDVTFIRSSDGGQTWTAPVRINDDPPGNGAWQWFGTLSVAPNGRIDAAWADTRDDPGGYDSAIYYSYSLDAGRTWSPNEALTPTFDPHVGWPQQSKIGDYYHMDSDVVGANLAYAATFNGEEDVYFLRIGEFDCNGNGVPDPDDILLGTSTDLNGNGIPDECEALGDLNCDKTTDFGDINPFVLAMTDPASYTAAYPDCPFENRDINGDQIFDFGDINPFVGLLVGAGGDPMNCPRQPVEGL